MTAHSDMLAEELADTLELSRGPLCDRVAAKYPELFYRVRMACCPHGMTPRKLNEHAALICRDVLDARRTTRVPYGHLSKARRVA